MYEVIVNHIGTNNEPMPEGFNKLLNDSLYYSLIHADDLDHAWELASKMLKKYPWLELEQVGEN